MNHFSKRKIKRKFITFLVYILTVSISLTVITCTIDAIEITHMNLVTCNSTAKAEVRVGIIPQLINQTKIVVNYNSLLTTSGHERSE